MRNALLILFVLLPAAAAAQIAVLHVSPAALAFVTSPGQGQPPPQQVRIRNTGSGPLLWRATASAPWIRVSPASGTGPAAITVSIDTARLGPGPHDGTITIDAGDADDSPTTIAITAQSAAATRATVPPPAAPRIRLTALAGATSPATSALTLDGPRDAATEWRATSDQPWLSIEPPTGTTPSPITIKASPARLAAGDYDATIRFLDDAGEPLLVVPVTLSVGAAGSVPSPAGEAASHAGKPDEPGPLTIEARGLPPAMRNLPYAQTIPVKGGKPPYAIRLAQGRLPPGLLLMNGAIAGTTRVPGNYLFTITVTDSATPPATITQQLPLRVIILQQDTALVVDPPALVMTVAGAQKLQRARIAVGSGRHQLEWQATSDAAWLKVVPPGGVTPGVVQLEASAAGLASGTYVATVTIEMEGVPNSPARVSVQLVVRR